MGNIAARFVDGENAPRVMISALQPEVVYERRHVEIRWRVEIFLELRVGFSVSYYD
jgi:hypothetical protein